MCSMPVKVEVKGEDMFGEVVGRGFVVVEARVMEGVAVLLIVCLLWCVVKWKEM